MNASVRTGNIRHFSVHVGYLSVNDVYLSVNVGYLSVHVDYLSVQVGYLSAHVGYLTVVLSCVGFRLVQLVSIRCVIFGKIRILSELTDFP